jgi:hypothetical protein
VRSNNPYRSLISLNKAVYTHRFGNNFLKFTAICQANVLPIIGTLQNIQGKEEMSMGAAEAGILAEIVAGTGSELLIFFVILTVILVAVLLPLYRISMEKRSELHRREHERDVSRLDKFIQREAHIINVIKENSEVIAGLKATFENSGVSTTKTLERIEDTQRVILDEVAGLRNSVDRH